MPNVAIASSGLEHVRRGYEVFADQLFVALQRSEDLDVRLLKGSGSPSPHADVLRCIRRDTAAVKRVAKALDQPELPYVVEAASFATSVVRLLRNSPTDVVITSDRPTAIALAVARWLLPHRFRILFRNGGGHWGPFPYADLVAHLTEISQRRALGMGETPARSIVLPNAIHIDDRSIPSMDERRAIRSRIGLPLDRRIVVAVGAVGQHKRHDHLARAIASMSEPRPWLLIVGDASSATDAVLGATTRALGADGYAHVTVPPADVPDLYRAADVFALASTWESFGRAYAEAAAAGLPCVVNDFDIAREVLGPWGQYCDMTDVSSTAKQLQRALDLDRSAETIEAQRAWIRSRYGWAALMPRYEDAVRRAARMRPTAVAPLVPVTRRARMRLSRTSRILSPHRLQ